MDPLEVPRSKSTDLVKLLLWYLVVEIDESVSIDSKNAQDAHHHHPERP